MNNKIAAPPGSKPVRVLVKDLKALIFVKDFAGNPRHEEARSSGPIARSAGGASRCSRDGPASSSCNRQDRFPLTSGSATMPAGDFPATQEAP